MRSLQQMLEDRAYENDARNCEPAGVPVLYVEQADGTVAEVALPTRWEVCPVCEGAGTHVNPAIDAGGLTAEDFADDPDFAEDYFAGAYDQTCNRCKGRSTVREVDFDRLSPEVRELYERQLREEAATRAEERAERLMGA